MLDINSNRTARNYSAREIGYRAAWSLGNGLFRLIPRPLFELRSVCLRLFGARVGKQVRIYPSARIYFPWNLVIGDWSSIGEWALVYDLGKVTIGNKVTISQRVHLCAGSHDYRDPAMPLLKPPIQIADEAWICADAFVGPRRNSRRRGNRWSSGSRSKKCGTLEDRRRKPGACDKEKIRHPRFRNDQGSYSGVGARVRVSINLENSKANR